MYNKKKAFTLIEVIIVLALLTIVMGVIYQFFFSSNRDLNDTDVKANLQFEGQQIQNSFTNYGSQGNTITALNGNNPPPADSTERGIENLTLTLYAGTETIAYNYTATNKTLTETHTKEDGTTTTKTLSDKVESINIKPIGGTYDVASGMTIKVTLQDKGITYSITSNVVFRNKGVTTQ
ncbi:type II secretion system protein [Clostridium fungisolvens]|uniref:Prepilin-type N-terminal cleavage/methylation domain-containing protein n=1 Tax=Clostridium fungisolvens TaxID=1604897 RepID=A0A6V8SLY8_9CLOT|nr:prepilin-type N-terminal cleavage/methylation domain-containing protein [Clostridium fungisolvens]GFP77562.1 hypothetical protein bsdtw1_03720 [Clostridium fungisolvens]